MLASWLGRYRRYIAGSLLTGTAYTESIWTGNVYHVQKVCLFAPRQSCVGFLDWVSQSWIHNPGLGFSCMLSFILFLFGQVAFSFTLWFFYGKESRMKVGLPLSTQRRTNCVFFFDQEIWFWTRQWLDPLLKFPSTESLLCQLAGAGWRAQFKPPKGRTGLHSAYTLLWNKIFCTYTI